MPVVISATGTVVENLSNRKLCVIVVCLALVELVFILLGGLVAPQPSSHMAFEMTMCIDRHHGDQDRWFYLRPSDGCEERLDSTKLESNVEYHLPVDARDIVFVAQMPHIRNNAILRYSPWFQSMLTVLNVQTQYTTHYAHWKMAENPELYLDVRLGYQKNNESPSVWHEFSSATVKRRLRCEEPDPKRELSMYSCEPIEFFELGSVDYPFYLVNIRIPYKQANSSDGTEYNTGIGRLTGLQLIEIHQNGGFTQIWLSLKTVLLFSIVASMIWYWRRISQLPRKPLLVEKTVMTLGGAMLILNTPVEWLSLITRTPAMLLIADMRQGFFYAVFFSFLLIYVGEHLLDYGGNNKLSRYWKHLSAVLFACACMFVFDMCERGVHLTNPFYSIWSTALGTNLAYGFVILASVSACIYGLMLFYWIFLVIATIKRKRASFANSAANRRLRFEAIIYRFKFLMIFTFICVALTVAFFITTKVGEDQLHWGDWENSPLIHYSSAFLTGTYGLWNIYTMFLLFMYAPSHKQYSQSVRLTGRQDEDEDLFLDVNESQSIQCYTEASALTTFTKQTTD